jgi:uncharacterized membrane protein YhaH (DUF805 family)
MFNMLFGLEGRIARGQYWLLWSVQSTLALVLTYISLTTESDRAAWTSYGLEAVLGWMIFCRIGKRLHDRGKSAWSGLAMFVPGLGLAWEAYACGFHPGEPHANAYGPAPFSSSNKSEKEGASLEKFDDAYFENRLKAMKDEGEPKIQHAVAASPRPPQFGQAAPATFGKRRD